MVKIMDELEELKHISIVAIINREGGYVDHPDDRGGPTKYGITLAVARENGYYGEMKDFPMDEAIEIYEARYWTPLQLDEIAIINESLASRLFDYGVNSGVGRAGKDLQRLLNVLNNQGKYYSDVKVDGAIGTKTLSALHEYYVHRGANGMHVMSEALNGMRIDFCIRLAEKRESQEGFIFGWLSRIVEVG